MMCAQKVRRRLRDRQAGILGLSKQHYPLWSQRGLHRIPANIRRRSTPNLNFSFSFASKTAGTSITGIYWRYWRHGTNSTGTWPTNDTSFHNPPEIPPLDKIPVSPSHIWKNTKPNLFRWFNHPPYCYRFIRVYQRIFQPLLLRQNRKDSKAFPENLDSSWHRSASDQRIHHFEKPSPWYPTCPKVTPTMP